jgi:fructose-1,6-bisphosphatase III
MNFTPAEVPHPHGHDRYRADLIGLKSLSRDFSSIDRAISEIARLSGELTLPMGSIHVISDVHGEHRKLRHIINNASGTLRPLVERLLREKLQPEDFNNLLTLIFYPAEVVESLQKTLRTTEAQLEYGERILGHLFDVVRELAGRRSHQNVVKVFPPEFRELLGEILNGTAAERNSGYIRAIIHELASRSRVLHLIHLTGRVIRNLAIDEIVIAGDCWDRGPRGDKVVDYLICVG